MKKLVNGILAFREKLHPQYRETFARLALGQSPDALFIGCSDSRVAVNVFASTDPGDLFVIRNVGNMVPECGCDGHSSADESEAAAIEFALIQLKVSNIIVCGHSECGAMQALLQEKSDKLPQHLRSWLRHGETSIPKLGSFNKSLARHNELSQLNVLQQIENLKSYPVVRERIEAKTLNIHAWWFDLQQADVYAYDTDHGQFCLFSDELAAKILKSNVLDSAR